MQILALVRDYIRQYHLIVQGGWNIADAVSRSYDIVGMSVGVIGSGRIGLAVLKRLKPFDVALHYTDRHRLPVHTEEELGLTFHSDVESLVKVCDVVSIHVPLHPETEHLFNDELISKMKRGSYLVNTARGKICERDAIVKALDNGQLAGYAGDVWFHSRRRRITPAHHAQPCNDSAYIGHFVVSSSSLCRRRKGNLGVLVRRQAHQRRIPYRTRRPSCWCRGPFLQ